MSKRRTRMRMCAVCDVDFLSFVCFSLEFFVRTLSPSTDSDTVSAHTNTFGHISPCQDEGQRQIGHSERGCVNGIRCFTLHQIRIYYVYILLRVRGCTDVCRIASYKLYFRNKNLYYFPSLHSRRTHKVPKMCLLSFSSTFRHSPWVLGLSNASRSTN